MRQFLLGVGSPLVDYSAAVSEEFLSEHISGSKGGTQNISDTGKEQILRHISSPVFKVAGGAAANTVMAAAELGVTTSLFGKTGNDENSVFFREAMNGSGASAADLLISETMPTGYCLTLVTPDAERTMRSNLGASLDVSPQDAENFDFSRFQWVLAEGYFIDTGFFEAVLESAKAAGCKVAVDLCSFELAGKYRERFIRLLTRYADLLFANFDEAAALTEEKNSAGIMGCLKNILPAAALKLGSDGSMVYADGKCHTVPAAPVKRVLDTTAAGDYYAAGFFYGVSRNMPWEKCGRAGSLAAAEIVAHTGTKLKQERWDKLKLHLENI